MTLILRRRPRVEPVRGRTDAGLRTANKCSSSCRGSVVSETSTLRHYLCAAPPVSPVYNFPSPTLLPVNTFTESFGTSVRGVDLADRLQLRLSLSPLLCLLGNPGGAVGLSVPRYGATGRLNIVKVSSGDRARCGR